MFSFQQSLGVVENIDTTSRQLRQALEDGKTIIVTTLQKFPAIARQMEELAGDPALEASVKVNQPENGRLTFDHVANDKIQEMIDTNFKFYKQITDDAEFEKHFLGWLFERYRQGPTGEGQP